MCRVKTICLLAVVGIVTGLLFSLEQVNAKPVLDPIKLVTQYDGFYQTANSEETFFECLSNKDGSANIYYTSSVASMEYLCTNEECDHRGSYCSSWLSSQGYLFLNPAQTKLFAIELYNSGYNENERIFEMNTDGSEKKELFALEPGKWFIDAVVASNSTFYVTECDINAAGNVANTVIAYNYNTNEKLELLDIPRNTHLCGAYNESLLFVEQLEEEYRFIKYDVNTKKREEIYALVADPENNAFAVFDDELFVARNNEIVRINLADGKQRTICNDIDLYNIEALQFVGKNDGKITVKTVDNMKKRPEDISVNQINIDLDTGQLSETKGMFKIGNLQKYYTIEAEINEFFIVSTGIKMRTVSLITSAGDAYSYDEFIPQYCAIAKEDYWNNNYGDMVSVAVPDADR